MKTIDRVLFERFSFRLEQKARFCRVALRLGGDFPFMREVIGMDVAGNLHGRYEVP